MSARIIVCSLLMCCVVAPAGRAQSLPPDATYRPLPTAPLDAVKKSDTAAKPAVMQRQSRLLSDRYDLANRPVPGVKMSGGRKAVQGGVRVKLPAGLTWDQLAAMTPEEITQKGAFPAGFMRLPHVKQSSGMAACGSSPRRPCPP